MRTAAPANSHALGRTPYVLQPHHAETCLALSSAIDIPLSDRILDCVSVALSSAIDIPLSDRILDCVSVHCSNVCFAPVERH